MTIDINLKSHKRKSLKFKIEMDEIYVASWLERLAVNAKVATVLGSVTASSDTMDLRGRQMKQC